MDKLNENDTMDTTNPFYQLLEKQATEVELLGQRLKSEIQNSYREFCKFQQQQQISIQRGQITNNEVTTDPIEKVVDSSTNDSQLKLIDSLKARIEELETDSIIRNQEIQQLKQELNKFKNISELKNELEKMKKEIDELNDFKKNFILKTKEAKSKSQHIEFDSKRNVDGNNNKNANSRNVNGNNNRNVSSWDVNENNNWNIPAVLSPKITALPKVTAGAAKNNGWGVATENNNSAETDGWGADIPTNNSWHVGWEATENKSWVATKNKSSVETDGWGADVPIDNSWNVATKNNSATENNSWVDTKNDSWNVATKNNSATENNGWGATVVNNGWGAIVNNGWGATVNDGRGRTENNNSNFNNTRGRGRRRKNK